MVYNLVGVLLIPSLMHRRVLKGEQGRFYGSDIGAPLAAAVITAGCVRLLIADTTRFEPVQLLALLLLAAAVVQLASAMAAAGTRRWMWSVFHSVRA
jgi:hypothetical protein